MELTPAQRRYLRAQAHSLHPVVMIGDAGLTEAVVKEADRALNSHELIKVKAATDDRESRAAMLASLCDALGAVAIQHIGKTLVIYRPSDNPKIRLP